MLALDRHDGVTDDRAFDCEVMQAVDKFGFLVRTLADDDLDRLRLGAWRQLLLDPVNLCRFLYKKLRTIHY
ncbi:MAG: hypothetical protein FD188_3426 [Ignavibacteria bacterium]|nr:MAG: hypothetical protein FD188_3426 [Ignavibacteria bacterium]